MFLGSVLLMTGCAEQKIVESLAETTVVEGRRFAEEVEAQSPFETVEMRWAEANEMIKKRNPAFVAARQKHTKALRGKPLVGEVTREVKDTVKLSFGEMFDTKSLVASLKAPAVEFPKRLASVTKLKDLSHQMQQEAWEDAEISVDAEMEMRKVKVKLHRLLRTGKLIEREMKLANADPPPEAKSDSKFPGELNKWRSTLENEREKWLTEVRDIFDAEYQDVHFIPDDTGLPTYQNAYQPELGKWQRWSHLSRSKELINKLGTSHKESKPTIPGASAVTDSLMQMFEDEKDKEEGEEVRQTSSVREEVRSLIQTWRNMKEAQREANELEKSSQVPPLTDRGQIGTRQKIFSLRRDEIKHAAVLWLLDEKCWQ